VLRLVLVLAAVYGATLLGLGLKALIMRGLPRGRAAQRAFASFPSGHTLGTKASAVALVMISHAGRARPWLAAGLVTCAIGTGISRIYLGMLWLTDVLAGWAAGVALSLGLWLEWDAPPGERATRWAPCALVVAFDWGNSLVVDTGQPGPMVEWARVEAAAGARKALDGVGVAGSRVG